MSLIWALAVAVLILKECATSLVPQVTKKPSLTALYKVHIIWTHLSWERGHMGGRGHMNHVPTHAWPLTVQEWLWRKGQVLTGLGTLPSPSLSWVRLLASQLSKG